MAATLVPLPAEPDLQAALLLSEAGGTLTALQGEPFLDALPLEESGGWLAATTDPPPPLLAGFRGSPGPLGCCPRRRGRRRRAGARANPSRVGTGAHPRLRHRQPAAPPLLGDPR